MCAERPLLRPLVKGLRHSRPSIQTHCFSSLTALLQLDKKIGTKEFLLLVDNIVMTDARASKGEKRLVQVGRILAFGALVRANRILSENSEFLDEIFTELISLAKKKVSLLVIATPFICELLLLSKISSSALEAVQSLISSYSEMNSCLLQIALTARQNHSNFVSECLQSVEQICNVITDIKLEDSAYFDLLFSFLTSSGKVEEFWECIPSKLNASHIGLLCSLIETSSKNCVSHKCFINREVITLLVPVFRKQNKDMLQKARASFHFMLQWNNSNCSMNEKERKQAIKLLFSDKPNVLHEYKFLHASLRQFITLLTSEELDFLVEICNPLLHQERLGRHTVSAISFLARIGLIRGTKSSTKVNIMKTLFVLGFCTGTDQNFEIPIKKSREAFTALLKHTTEKYVVNKLFQYVSRIATGRGARKNSLSTNLAPENLEEWEKLSQLALTVGNAHISMCLKLHAFLLIVDPSIASFSIERLVSICTDTEGQSMSEKWMSFILASALDGKAIFNYDALFSRLLMEEEIQSDSIQILVDALDFQIETNKLSDDEDSDDEDSEDYNDEDEEGGDSEEKSGNQLSSFGNENNCIKMVDSSHSDEVPTNNEESDVESSIDMDEASEAELDRIDLAFSKIFSQKRGGKDSQEGVVNLVRVVRLVESLMKRYKIPVADIPLMLLMPCINSLVKCSKTSRLSAALSPCMSSVKWLNSIKKVTGLENIADDLKSDISKDIQQILKKKLSKDVRRVLKGSLAMLSRCYKVDVPSSQQSSKNINKKLESNQINGRKRNFKQLPTESIDSVKHRKLFK